MTGSAHKPAARRSGARVRCAVVCALVLVLSASAAFAGERLATIDRLSGVEVEWLVTNGKRVVFGSGTTLVVVQATGFPAIEREIELPRRAVDAALLGDRLFLAYAGGRLARMDLDDPESVPREESLVPEPLGETHIAQVDGHLVIAEDRRGLSFFRLHAPHHGAGSRAGQLVQIGFLALERVFSAVAAHERTVVVAADGAELIEIDVADPRLPRVSGVFGATGVDALAVNNSSLFLVNREGLSVRSRAAGGVEVFPELAGNAIDLAGRTVYIGGKEGVAEVRDTSPSARVHSVIVGNDFFSPEVLTIGVGDMVKWTNASGLHNVFSCVPEQEFCGGTTSTETFVSGPPALPIWIYNHTFQLPGENPYLCQSHAAIMPGMIFVESSAPPGVSDGANGEPMRVDRLDPTGGAVELTWDAASCLGAKEHHVVYGTPSRLPDEPGGIYRPAGAECSVGNSPYVWNTPPVPGGAASRLLWWLIVAGDNAGTEGSWGRDGAGNERRGPEPDGASGQCHALAKDLTNPCGQ